MSSKDNLTTEFVIDTKQADKAIDRMISKFDKLSVTIRKMSDTSIKQLAKGVQQVTANASQLTAETEKSERGLGDLTSLFEKIINNPDLKAWELFGYNSAEAFLDSFSEYAEELNSVIDTVKLAGQQFDFKSLGEYLGQSINVFFETFDFGELSSALNIWVDGLEVAVGEAIEKIDWSNILQKVKEGLSTLEFDTVAVVFGTLLLTNKDSFFVEMLSKGLKMLFPEGVTLSSLPVVFSSIIPLMGTPAFDMLGAWILDGIDDALVALLPDWVYNFLDQMLTGLVLGALAGSWIPVVGPLGGAIIGAILGAMNSIVIDGKSILMHIAEGIFNFDYFEEVSSKATELFRQALVCLEELDLVGAGVNIIEGIVQGLWAGLVFLAEPIADIFVAIYEGIRTIFGIHSPAEEMKPLGENILLGIVEGFLSMVGIWAEEIQAFFDNDVKPWFTKEKWIETIGSIKEALLSKWSDATDGWLQKKPLSTISFSIANLRERISEVWSEAKNWWDNNKPNLSEIATKIKIPKLTVTWNTTGWAAEALQKLGLKGYPNFSVAYYAQGGFPEDGWFRANHGEIMGRFDNGKSVVANNRQITEGISDAVYRGNQVLVNVMRQELEETKKQNNILMGILEKETGINYYEIFKASQKGAREYTQRTGRLAYDF